MNILVTGGAGYIGSHLVPKLLAADHHVWVIDDLSNSEAMPPGVIQMLGTCGALQLEDDFDVIIHLAGEIAVGASSDLHWQNNVCEPISLLSRISAKKIIVASSAAVYGGAHYTGPQLAREDDPLIPMSAYGRTKVALEQLTTDCFIGNEITILRLFNVAGGKERHKHETHILPLALTGEVSVHGPAALRMVRDYVHVEDVADAFVSAIHSPPGIYNIGRGTGVPTHELLAEVQRNRPLKVIVGSPREGDPPFLVADTQLARAHLGWQPKHDLESIVRSAWEHYMSRG